MKDEASPRVPANFADGDMKPSELAEVLAGLNFSRGASVSLELDKAVRDYLLDAIRQRHASRSS